MKKEINISIISAQALNQKMLSKQNLQNWEDISQEEYEAFEQFFKAYVPKEYHEDLKQTSTRKDKK